MTLENLKDYNLKAIKKPEITLRDYYDLFYEEINCNPLHQRPPVEAGVGCPKSVAIINSIMIGIDIQQITLVKLVDGAHRLFIYESLDGGHRKRAIYQFMNDEFEWNGMLYSQLPSDLKKKFDNYTLSFTIYDPLPNFLKGYIFRSINETTDVNNQETLNSFGDSKIASLVRETVRKISANGDVTTPHELFELTSTENNYKYLSDNNMRLNLEEFVSRVLYRVYKGGTIGSRTYEQLTEMFLDEEVDIVKLKAKLDKVLDFLLKMAKARYGGTIGSRTYEQLTEMFLDEEVDIVKLKAKLDKVLDFLLKMAKARYGGTSSKHQSLPKGEMNVLANFYFYMDEFYPNWYLEDPMTFYQKFREVWVDYWSDKSMDESERKYAKLVDFEYESNEVTIAEAFKSYTTEYQHEEKQRQCVKFITDVLDVEEFFITENRERDFKPILKEKKLIEQGHKCAIDGKPLTWEDAHAAHIQAWSKGGKTTYSNLAMVRKEYNWDMKTMNLEEYKETVFNVA